MACPKGHEEEARHAKWEARPSVQFDGTPHPAGEWSVFAGHMRVARCLAAGRTPEENAKSIASDRRRAAELEALLRAKEEEAMAAIGSVLVLQKEVEALQRDLATAHRLVDYTVAIITAAGGKVVVPSDRLDEWSRRSWRHDSDGTTHTFTTSEST